MSYQTLNPYTGVIEKSFLDAETAEVDNVLNTLNEGYLSWKKLSVFQRQKSLQLRWESQLQRLLKK